MKKGLRIVGILVVILILASLVLTFNLPGQEEKEIINLENKEFPDGIYYEYEAEISEIDIESEIKKLKVLEAEEAWYKPGSSSCCPPGQEEPVKCLNAIVDPVLIVKFGYEQEVKDFIRVENPNLGWCAYYIQYFNLK